MVFARSYHGTIMNGRLWCCIDFCCITSSAHLRRQADFQKRINDLIVERAEKCQPPVDLALGSFPDDPHNTPRGSVRPVAGNAYVGPFIPLCPPPSL